MKQLGLAALNPEVPMALARRDLLSLTALVGVAVVSACASQQPGPAEPTSLPPTESRTELIDYVTAEVVERS